MSKQQSEELIDSLTENAAEWERMLNGLPWGQTPWKDPMEENVSRSERSGECEDD